MTWKEFKDQVDALLGEDANRMGAETLVPMIVRLAVLDAQRLVPRFRINHETVYYAGDLVVEGLASRGVFPPEAVVRDMYLCRKNDDDDWVRHPVTWHDWEDRYELTNGLVQANDGFAKVARDRSDYTFYVYPFVEDCQRLSVHWDGRKLEFKDDEETPFDERLSQPVADYVKARIFREFDRDIQGHDSFMKSYTRALALIYTDK